MAVQWKIIHHPKCPVNDVLHWQASRTDIEPLPRWYDSNIPFFMSWNLSKCLSMISDPYYLQTFRLAVWAFLSNIVIKKQLEP